MPPCTARGWRALAIATLLVIAAGGLVVWCLDFTDRWLWQGGQLGPLGLRPSRALVLGAAVLLLLGAVVSTASQRSLPRWLRRVGVLGGGFVATLLVVEVGGMFFAESHHVGYTLAAQVWFGRYWGTENSLGYRDVEPVRLPGRRLVLVVGDSFTAGAGVAIEERFTSVLARRRPDLQVVNAGRCGADSLQELARLRAFPLAPDAVVLQFYPNDIDGIAVAAGVPMPQFHPYEDLRSVKMRWLVRSSFLANFVYWRTAHADAGEYWQFFARAVADPVLAERERQVLGEFVAFANERHIPLVFVAIPMLDDLARARPLTQRVAAAMRELGACVVDVEALVADLPAAQRVVHARDHHASPRVHERIAAAIDACLPASR